MMKRPYNFSAGPAMCPLPVLEQVAQEMCDWHGTGISVMEMSHRSEAFGQIINHAEQTLRKLLNIPKNFQVLFVSGGATLVNAAVAMNLVNRPGACGVVDVVHTGTWSGKVLQEAAKYAKVHTVVSSEQDNFCCIPLQQTWQRTAGAAYLHVCTNETIHGNQFHFVPEKTDVPIVADMTSEIMSRPIDFDTYDVVYAGAQKNLGIAGLTILIVREDLIGFAQSNCPIVLNWQNLSKANSLVNTPACFAIYVCGLVLDWIASQGGISVMEQMSIEKSSLLYTYIDQSALYGNFVEDSCRSRMNVPFFLKDKRLDEVFIQEAAQTGIVQIQGHRTLGGMRASLYNAMPVAGVKALVDFMRDFENRYFHS